MTATALTAASRTLCSLALLMQFTAPEAHRGCDDVNCVQTMTLGSGDQLAGRDA